MQSANAGSYSVLVSNSAGNATSSTATLTVNSLTLAPSISTPPASQSVTTGTAVTFTVAASGTSPLTYQWRKGNQDIVGATSPTYSLSNVQSGDAANYSVVVTNSAGSVTSNAATLTVTTTGTAPTITAQPSDQTVGAGVGASATFTVGVSGTAPFTYQWRKNGAAIAGATNATLVLAVVTTANAGSYTVLVTNAVGSATSGVAVLTLVDLPVITVPPVDLSVAVGSPVVFTVLANGTPPLTYQWRKDGRPIAGADNSTLALTAVTDADAGSYAVGVTNGAGTVTSRTVTLVVSPAVSKIVNLSVRSGAGAGNETLIVGFVIAGQGAPKPVLVRGIGPSLTQFGVTGVLADPELTLYRESIFIQANDDWGASPLADQIAATIAATGAFPIGRSSKDAALRVMLQPGAYTANVSSRAGTGIALVEVYDADTPALTRLVNVSARSIVDRGAGVLIVGFAIQGNTSKTVLVRGIGPALAPFGVAGTLADPQLVLFKEGSEVIATNDDWWRGGGAQALAPVFNAVGAFPLVSGLADAALMATLPPGSYTAQVKGAGDATGVALIEVYEVP
ncbi:MAG: immunoglobulin domain-containing protein [Verrucomicrobia bacterium]|nr:immunoglobulin domain-containing protein [Verrucomicrobiota bacterium]